jgi:hypothetical protein
MKKRSCKFGKVKSGARKGKCRLKPQRHPHLKASLLYGLSGKKLNIKRRGR